MISSSLQISVPGGWLAYGSISSGLSKLDARIPAGVPCRVPPSAPALAPCEASSSLLERDLVEPAFGTTRICRIDAIDIDADVRRSAWIAAAVATAEVSRPPQPGVMQPVCGLMPWKPAMTATSRSP